MALPTPLAPFNATFEPDPEPGYQFTFTNSLGALVNNAFFVEEENASVTITLTNPGAMFSPLYDPPLAWSIEPGSFGYSVSPDRKELTLSGIPIPAHLFQPWIFRIIVDVDDVNAVRSQNIYLVKNQLLDGASFFLKYSIENGNFSLLDSLTASSQDGAILADTLALINTQVPLSGSYTFTVALDTTDPAISFSSSPAIFNPSPLGWLTAAPVSPPGEPPSVEFTLFPAAIGQSGGVQFSLSVPTPTGTITVLSPDPIIMNTTIGDG